MMGSHTYYEGTYIKKKRERIVGDHYGGITVFSESNITFDPRATEHRITYADGTEYSNYLWPFVLWNGTNSPYYRRIPRDGQIVSPGLGSHWAKQSEQNLSYE